MNIWNWELLVLHFRQGLLLRLEVCGTWMMLQPQLFRSSFTSFSSVVLQKMWRYKKHSHFSGAALFEW